jgi:hypothetical protein
MKTSEIISALARSSHANLHGDRPLSGLLHTATRRMRDLQYLADVLSAANAEQIRLIEQIGLQYPDVAASEPYQSCVYRHHSARQATRLIDIS